LSATPKRAKTAKIKLGQTYQYKHIVTTPSELVRDNFLAPINIILPPDHADFAGLDNIPTHQKNGETDYNEGKLSKFMQKKSEIYAGFEQLFVKYNPKKVVLFCVDIEHCLTTTKRLLDAGIPTKFLTSDVNMPDADANLYDEKMAKWRLFGELKNGWHTGTKAQLFKDWGNTYKVLVSASMMTTGVDVQDIDTVAIMRPTHSENLFLQMVGRGTRPMPHKVLRFWDLSGLIKRHGHPYADRNYSLFPKKTNTKKGEAPTKSCPQCGGTVHASDRVCSNPKIDVFTGAFLDVCGYIFPKQAKVPIDSDFTELEWEEVANSMPAKIENVHLTPVAVWEYRQQYNAQTPETPIKLEWAFHRIHKDFGHQGLINLALARNLNTERFFKDLKLFTDIDL
jgi:superfamily II DNA or RNA helicase